MATVISHNILSPLGQTSIDNYNAMMAGRTSIATHTDTHDGRQYSASLFDDDTRRALTIEGCSLYESLVARSISSAIAGIVIDTASPRVRLILSTTKADIELIERDRPHYAGVAQSAERIAARLGFTTTPICVCNACISGLTAIITASRLIDNGECDYAVVCGCDVQSHFIVSGFRALNAVSPLPCRPFDIERNGLSPGEAAATIVLAARQPDNEWCVDRACVRNDAYHNTSPSPQGDGCYMALRRAVDNEAERLAFVNAHGTATLFNDQMEAKAIARACPTGVPVSALKGYVGHTMGAAGLLETIISMLAVDHGALPATKGYATRGVSAKINVVAEALPVGGREFVKVMSGFGGCNAAARMTKRTAADIATNTAGNATKPTVGWTTLARVTIDNNGAEVNGAPIATTHRGSMMLKEIYRNHVADYPKFHKMDRLSQLGFIAAELLMRATAADNIATGERCAIVLFNRSSSTTADNDYLHTIAHSDDYFPSPALFVYTLPNIALSEIAIRHKLNGETALYILPQRDESTIDSILKATLAHDTDLQTVVTGWIDCYADDNFAADIRLIRTNN